MILGIMAALPQEIDGLLQHTQHHMTSRVIGGRTFYQGNIEGIECVIVLARIGKVAASATCTTLIQTFGVTQIIFTGLAGAVHRSLSIGDVVIGQSFCQHDFNAEPLFPRYEIPLLNKAFFSSDVHLNQLLFESTTQFLHSEKGLTHWVSPTLRERFQLDTMRIHQGLIISGDQFISTSEAVADLHLRFPNALCTEMEGAAVAQICDEYQIPFAVMRVISDKADHSASDDFSLFLDKVAPYVSSGILLFFLSLL